MAAQTFRVTATPRARFHLAVLFFHKDLKFKDMLATRSLDKARRALGLVELSQQFSTHRRVGDIWRDNHTRNVFTVTTHDADFVLDMLGKLDKNADDLLYISDLLLQLDARKDAEDAETSPPFNDKEEAPLWNAELHPAVEHPATLINILRRYAEIQKNEPRGKAAEFLIEALTVPDDSANDNDAKVVPIEAAK